MSELTHIEIVEAETDSEGNILVFVKEDEEEEEDGLDEETFLYLDDDDVNDGQIGQEPDSQCSDGLDEKGN